MRHGDITDVLGIAVGHAHDDVAITGCTVVLCEEGATGGVCVAGAAPGTRETDLLRPENLVSAVHAVLLTGGSAFGLDAAGGVMRYLESRGAGFATGHAMVPIVPAAVIYDLGVGDASVRPDAGMGLRACEQATTGPVSQGNVGAGAGATVGKSRGPSFMMKGGLGSASIQLSDGVTVGAIVVANSFGDVYDARTGAVVAGALSDDGRPAGSALWGEGQASLGENTTIGVIAVDAAMDKAASNKVAQMAHDGLARAIRPVHTMFDGDTIFCLATGKTARRAASPMEISLIGAAAANMMSQAVINAVLHARSVGRLKSARDLAY